MRRGCVLALSLALGSAGAWSDPSAVVPGVYRMARLADVDGDGVTDLVVLAAQPGWDPARTDVEARRDSLHLFSMGRDGLSHRGAVPLAHLTSGFDLLDVDGDGVGEAVLITAAGILYRELRGEGPEEILTSDAFLHEDHADLDLRLTDDVDGDGHADLALPTDRGVTYRLWREGRGLREGPSQELLSRATLLGSRTPTLFARLAEQAAPPMIGFVRVLPFLRDLNGDGHRDAVLPLSGRLARFEGIRVHFGTGGVPPLSEEDRPIELSVGPGEVMTGMDEWAFGDLDGDGIAELALVTYDVEEFGFTQARRLRVFRFEEGFVPVDEPLIDVETKANLWEPTRVSLDDLDGDGRGDLTVVHMGGLRKTAFTVEHYEPRGRGGYRMREQTLKLDRDDDIDRARLVPPLDLDGDGNADFLVAGEKVVHLLRGRFEGSRVFEEGTVQRFPNADKVLDLLVHDAGGGYALVVVRYDDGVTRVHLLRLR